jgi:UDP-glucuronate 4-epimerase
MKILITGSAGFIGSSLAERLLARGDRVVGLDNFDDYYAPAIKRRNSARLATKGSFVLVEGDIRDPNKLQEIFAENSFDCIVHCAARAGVRPSLSDPLLYEDVNVRGTLNILNMARTQRVANTVACSSSSVYGNNSKVPFSEDDPVDHPISPYAATKKAAELLCYTYHHLYNLSVTCLRLFTVYGPRQRPEMAIHKFARRIDKEQPITMFGDGSSSRDYTYIEDLVDGLVHAVDTPLGYEIINLGESQTVTLRKLIAVIEQELGKKSIIQQKPVQAGDVERTYADIRKAQKLLGYRPNVSIEEGIRRFIAWYKEEGRSWLPFIQDTL